jgi:hypothetical protein
VAGAAAGVGSWALGAATKKIFGDDDDDDVNGEDNDRSSQAGKAKHGGEGGGRDRGRSRSGSGGSKPGYVLERERRQADKERRRAELREKRAAKRRERDAAKRAQREKAEQHDWGDDFSLDLDDEDGACLSPKPRSVNARTPAKGRKGMVGSLSKSPGKGKMSLKRPAHRKPKATESDAFMDMLNDEGEFGGSSAWSGAGRVDEPKSADGWGAEDAESLEGLDESFDDTKGWGDRTPSPKRRVATAEQRTAKSEMRREGLQRQSTSIGGKTKLGAAKTKVPSKPDHAITSGGGGGWGDDDDFFKSSLESSKPKSSKLGTKPRAKKPSKQKSGEGGWGDSGWGDDDLGGEEEPAPKPGKKAASSSALETRKAASKAEDDFFADW